MRICRFAFLIQISDFILKLSIEKELMSFQQILTLHSKFMTKYILGVTLVWSQHKWWQINEWTFLNVFLASYNLLHRAKKHTDAHRPKMTVNFHFSIKHNFSVIIHGLFAVRLEELTVREVHRQLQQNQQTSIGRKSVFSSNNFDSMYFFHFYSILLMHRYTSRTKIFIPMMSLPVSPVFDSFQQCYCFHL